MPPLPSGRSVTILDSAAYTVRGTQPARNGMCWVWMPRSPMQPYSPFTSTMRFQLMGLVTSMSLEWWKPARTSRMRPNFLSRIQPIRRWAAGK